MRKAASNFTVPYVSLPNFNGEDDWLMLHHLKTLYACAIEGRPNKISLNYETLIYQGLVQFAITTHGIRNMISNRLFAYK